MRIAIATTGRFHVLDLARELQALGHDVKFYSFVPRRRAERFGLSRECHVALLPFLFPFVAWERLFPKFLPRLRERVMFAALDAAATLRIRRCDVLIFMSGMYVRLPRTVRRRFGARLWIERGSQHILAQDQILQRSGAERPTLLAIQRELAGYVLADRIVIPSCEVAHSFERDCDAKKKLFRNPYGVNTKLFAPIEARRPESPVRFIFVGTWTRRKGCDLLNDAVHQVPGVTLIHVGRIGDLPFPQSNKFSHFDAVPQWKLREFYARADAFILASREEGLSLVQAQALCCGLPVIATDRTGASDLALTTALCRRIFVVPNGDIDALAQTIARLRDHLLAFGAFDPLPEQDREMLSWESYGRRYHRELLQDVLGHSSECTPSTS